MRAKGIRVLTIALLASVLAFATHGLTTASSATSITSVMELVYCLVGLDACPPPPCGPGTVYDEESHLCVAAEVACVDGEPVPAVEIIYTISDVMAEVYCLVGLGVCATDPGCADGTLEAEPPTVCTVGCEIDPCLDVSCSDHGMCVADGAAEAGFYCDCDAGWTGLACDEAVNACLAEVSPCPVNASCTSTGPGTYVCACHAGWEGSDCATNIDDCALDPCENGGTCVDGLGSYT